MNESVLYHPYSLVAIEPSTVTNKMILYLHECLRESRYDVSFCQNTHKLQYAVC